MQYETTGVMPSNELRHDADFLVLWTMRAGLRMFAKSESYGAKIT